MPFFVGAGMIGAGLLIAWGGISGRLAKILAALFAPNELTSAAIVTSSTSSTDSFEQLNFPQVTVA